jgi:hypothetical protein
MSAWVNTVLHIYWLIDAHVKGKEWIIMNEYSAILSWETMSELDIEMKLYDQTVLVALENVSFIFTIVLKTQTE